MTTAVDTKQGRFYPWKTDRFVSVTTIIGDGVPKPGLNYWKIKRMAALAAENRGILAELPEKEAASWLLSQRMQGGEDAANLGSTLHHIFDGLSGGGTMPELTVESEPYVQAYMKFIQDYNPVFIERESTVYSRTHGYAGTLDFIAEIDGKVVIGDYKTGKSVWPEAALQIAAYRYADFIGRPDGREDPIPACSRSAVLHIRPEGYKLVYVDTGPAVFDTFLSALDLYRWLSVDSDYVIGA